MIPNIIRKKIASGKNKTLNIHHVESLQLALIPEKSIFLKQQKEFIFKTSLSH